MKILPRFVHKLYAKFTGYFWLPCPNCGEMFGGHECSGLNVLIVLKVRDNPTTEAQDYFLTEYGIDPSLYAYDYSTCICPWCLNDKTDYIKYPNGTIVPAKRKGW